ncbi:NUDIX domain-containing protein [Humibacillus xanthopallidus]|uniref:8-oxo-dGTP pyrophosphatase MutT (NUDIX family) n=1 Tax=Humibacillus xanthopallidus TaxID=412689 RepID=A0A543HTS3_9MICO|nr:NUDIX hydrolase [Humibacillus xanthopallidus]TQM61761.1 8-oxo-dGTP pyrophosphatase MutT (NUDIX family) [Humibacillus xanthopallidus]
MSWPVTRTRVAYENPWIVVREDEVVRPDGSPGTYGVVEVRRPAVFVVALTDADEVVLVTIDRHTVGTSIEVPAGGTDGEDPLVAARRELAEETGLTAQTWRRVGEMSALNGICRAPEVVYLATDLGEDTAADDDGVDGRSGEQVAEGISAVSRVPVREVLAMIRRGEITDGETVAALMLALLELGRIA